MKQKLRLPSIIEDNFYKSINQAIARDRHVDYLKKVLKEYEDYKRFFKQAFTDKNSLEAVYCFRAVYLLKKSVWREILILGNQTFENLAEIIIESMGWDNDHMHGFSFPEKGRTRWDYSRYTFFADGWEDDPHPTYKSSQIMVGHIDYKKYPQLGFIFDFGDGHLFELKLKKIRKASRKETKKTLPIVIDQRGIAPEQYPDYEDYEE